MNEHLSKMFNSPMRVPISVGIISFVAGVGTGIGLTHILNRRNTYQRHEIPEQLDFDYVALEAFINEQEDKYGIEHPVKPEEPEDIPTETLLVGKEFVEQKIEDMTTTDEPAEPSEQEESVPRSIFAGNSDEWDYEKELKSRSSSEPYVLHKDEFYEDELGYTQTTLTYYAGDNILVDEEDAPVYNHDMIVGPMLFGHGSSDPNVFHVRNDKRKAEYEILLDPGLYSVEVLGLNIEDNQRVKDIKHSRRVPKFKME